MPPSMPPLPAEAARFSRIALLVLFMSTFSPCLAAQSAEPGHEQDQQEEPAWRRARIPAASLRKFDLSLVPEADTLFGIVSDTHVEPTPAPFSAEGIDDPRLKFRIGTPSLTNNARFVRAVEQINALGADFTVHLGDIVRSMPFGVSFDLEAQLSLDILSQLEAPYYLAPGNHDIGNKPSMGLAEKPPMKRTVCDENTELYRSFFGDPFLSWDHAGSHYIALNTMAFNSGIACDAEQWAWLRADLEAAKEAEHIFLFGHVALYWASPEDIGFRNYEVIDEPARSELLELVERYDVDAVFTGHTHHMFRNRYGESQLITAPSTAFARNTWALYPHMPARSMDAAKLAYLLVRVGDGRVITNHLRVVEGLPAAQSPQAGVLPAPLRVLTLQSAEAKGASLLLDAPIPEHVEAGWQAHDLIDGLVLQQPGVRDGRHAWRTFVGSGAVELPVELGVELAQERMLERVQLRGLGFQLDWILETSRDGSTWEFAGRGEGQGEASAMAGSNASKLASLLAVGQVGEAGDVSVELESRAARFVRLRVEDEMPAPGLFARLMLSEVEALDSEGINWAAAQEGAKAWSTAFGSTPRETYRDQAWLAAYDMANRQVRVSAGGQSRWEAVEHRLGAYQLAHPLRRALDAGRREGLELCLPLSWEHHGYSAQSEDERLLAFAAYCRWLATELGDDVAFWELPFVERDELGLPVGRTLDADEFVRLFRAMRIEVLAVLPQTRFAVSGLPLGNPRVLTSLIEQLGPMVDRLSVDPPQDQLVTSDDALLSMLQYLRPFLRAHPDVEWSLDLRPLEVSGAPALGALRVARAFLRSQAEGIRLGLRLDGLSGLLDAVDDPYPAFYSLRLLATLFDGDLKPVPNAPVFLEGDDFVQDAYQREDGSWLLAAWSNRRVEEHRAELVLPAGMTATAYDTQSCTSQELRVTQPDLEGTTEEEGQQARALGVLLREHPVVYLVR